jgi:rhodanese-related sulfurtransferase
METVAVVLAVLALLLALLALKRAGGQSAKIEELQREARRHVEGTSNRLESNVNNLRQIVAALAAAEPLTREMVLEGQLWHDVDPRKALELVEAGQVNIVDVRTPQETAGGVIPGAVLIPLDELEKRMREVPRNGNATLVYCAGGARSAAACEFLAEQGFGGLMNLTGGFGSWSGPRATPQ